MDFVFPFVVFLRSFQACSCGRRIVKLLVNLVLVVMFDFKINDTQQCLLDGRSIECL